MSREIERCELCTGRGYKPEKRRNHPDGFYARACPRCGGSGAVPVGSHNPDNTRKQREQP